MGKLKILDYGTDGIEIDVEVPIALTKSVSDVMRPESRQGEWSKTISIQGYSEVNKAFTHIYEINETITSDSQYTPSYNPNKRARVEYSENGIIQLYGFIRLIEINKILETSEIVFQCQIMNDVSNFFNDIEGKSMADVDLTQYDHELTKELVRKSWGQNIIENGVQVPFAKGKGYVHALINKRPYGGTVGATDPTIEWNVSDTTPCVYAKEIVDYIYEDSGTSYVSGGFFDSAEFKNWVVPYNGISLGSSNTKINFNLAQASTTFAITTGGGFFPPNVRRADLLAQNEIKDLSGSYVSATTTYTSPINASFTIAFDCDISFALPSLVPNAQDFGCHISLKVLNTTTGQIVGTNLKNFQFPGGFVGLAAQSFQFEVPKVDFLTGDDYEFFIETYGSAKSVDATISVGGVLTIIPNEVNYGFGSEVTFIDFFDRKLSQKDFILDMIRTFNLWIDVNEDGEHIVETRDDYLTDEVIDIEQLINTDKEVSYLPMGALNARRYEFDYKEGKDVLNQLYQYRNSSNYGFKEYEVDNDFVKNTKKITVNYSPTPMLLFDSSGMVLSDITFLDNEGNADKSKNFNYRFLRYEGIETCSPYHIVDNTGTSLQTGYPLIGHIDDPLNPTLDGLFGMPNQHYMKRLFKATNNTLWFQYYLKQYKEITDKNSKIVTAYLNISEADYPNLLFDKIYYFDNAYFRLNKIFDYKPRQDTKAEFLKLVEYSKPASQSGGVGGWDDFDDFEEGFPTSDSLLTAKGFSRGVANNINDTGVAVGNGNTYNGFDQVSIFNGNNNVIDSNVAKATIINLDDQEISQDGIYMQGTFIKIENLPTVPTELGQLYNDGGTLKISV